MEIVFKFMYLNLMHFANQLINEILLFMYYRSYIKEALRTFH